MKVAGVPTSTRPDLAPARIQELRMIEHDAARTWWNPMRRLPVDDAYTAWFSAHSRCTEALRKWNAAAPGERAVAYRVYLAALNVEEAAAGRLEGLHPRTAAA
jgi:hypothetical protein